MTELLDRAVANLRALSPEQQDDVARMLLQWAGADQPVIALTPGEEASFAPSLTQADNGVFATDADVDAVWSKHGR